MATKFWLFVFPRFDFCFKRVFSPSTMVSIRCSTHHNTKCFVTLCIRSEIWSFLFLVSLWNSSVGTNFTNTIFFFIRFTHYNASFSVWLSNSVVIKFWKTLVITITSCRNLTISKIMKKHLIHRNCIEKIINTNYFSGIPFAFCCYHDNEL